MKGIALALAAAGAALMVFVCAFAIFFTSPAAAVDATSCLVPEGNAWTLDAEQRANAELIIAAGKELNVAPRGWGIAIATAAQESSLHNKTTPDAHGSSGLFQQTPPGWGTRDQVNDPPYAARAFFRALLKVSGWETMPLTVAAQTVQGSAHPTLYADDAATAINAVRDLAGVELDCSKVTTPGSAQPAPRNPDGTWPKEGCTIQPDPTTGRGCLTPRTLHMTKQAAGIGYTNPSCFRQSTFGEHPLGRACDFMVTSGGTATGAQKQRGETLAAWAVNNADKLGVYYVIWYQRIWMPGRGWEHYTPPGGGSDPSSLHTNHVHISMY